MHDKHPIEHRSDRLFLQFVQNDYKINVCDGEFWQFFLYTEVGYA